jgi:hypothetical protein
MPQGRSQAPALRDKCCYVCAFLVRLLSFGNYLDFWAGGRVREQGNFCILKS